MKLKSEPNDFRITKADLGSEKSILNLRSLIVSLIFRGKITADFNFVIAEEI
jgi:hypothetical protein